MKVAYVSKIQSPNQYHASFKGISFVGYNNKFQNIKYKLQQELTKFANGEDNVLELGAGKFGETFRFKDPVLRNVVIKRSKGDYKDKYELEYENLISVPNDKVGGQAGIARVQNTKTSEFYLVSTMAEGKDISQYNRYNENHLKSLFTKMFELDKVGLYHGDLNGKNILLTKTGEINFIDYQWAQKVASANTFDAIKSEALLLPVSNFPENAQMFEMATMPYYIESIGNKKEKEEFLKIYLKSKAEYHAKRYDHIKKLSENWPYSFELNLIRESLKAELAKSKILKNPTDDILRLQLKKFQFLSDYRDAFGHVDDHMLDRNILTSPSAHLCSLSAVQDYRKEIYNQMCKSKDADLKAYLKAEMDYGDFWLNKLSEYSQDVFAYIMRTITKKEKHDFYINDRNPRIMKENRNVLSAMDSRFHTHYDCNFNQPSGIQRTMHEIYSEPMDLIRKESGLNNLKAYHRRKKIQHAYKELKDFNRNGKVLDLLNTAELITLKTSEFLSYVYHNMNSYILTQRLSIMKYQSANFTEQLFSEIYNGLQQTNASRILVQGYKEMRKFKFKV